MNNPIKEVKYILLLARDLRRDEKQEFKRFFRTYSYDVKTQNDRTINQLFDDYDVVAIDIFSTTAKQFYAESLKLIQGQDNIIKVYVGKLDEATRDDKNDIIQSWSIDYFAKKIPTGNHSKEELLHKITCALLPKPKKISYFAMFGHFLVSVLCYILPKLK